MALGRKPQSAWAPHLSSFAEWFTPSGLVLGVIPSQKKFYIYNTILFFFRFFTEWEKIFSNEATNKG